jgi:hypothetical protein
MSEVEFRSERIEEEMGEVNDDATQKEYLI